MREVPRDDKWQAEREENDRRRDAGPEPVVGEVLNSSPSETELVIVALLMRLYDINLALLTEKNAGRANDIYDTHERGGHFNPPLFIPGED